MRVGIPVADLTAGLFCAMGILTALLEREVSGEGQWVQTSLLQAQIFMLDFQAARWLMEKDVAKQAGNNHPTSIPTGVFKTSDGYINIATTGGRIWERCTQTLGAPEFITDPDYATAPARSKNRDALNAAIGKLTEKKSTEIWVNDLTSEGGGYAHIMPPNRNACVFQGQPYPIEWSAVCVGASSFHPGGVNVGFLDGSVRFVKDGVALTPPIESGLLPGITRAFLFEVGVEAGVPIREAILRDDDLLNADEVFFTSTTRGVVPATRVDERVIGSGMPGPVTLALRAAYMARATRSGGEAPAI